jgi:hypothetical protein
MLFDCIHNQIFIIPLKLYSQVYCQRVLLAMSPLQIPLLLLPNVPLSVPPYCLLSVPLFSQHLVPPLTLQHHQLLIQPSYQRRSQHVCLHVFPHLSPLHSPLASLLPNPPDSQHHNLLVSQKVILQANQVALQLLSHQQIQQIQLLSLPQVLPANPVLSLLSHQLTQPLSQADSLRLSRVARLLHSPAPSHPLNQVSQHLSQAVHQPIPPRSLLVSLFLHQPVNHHLSQRILHLSHRVNQAHSLHPCLLAW